MLTRFLGICLSVLWISLGVAKAADLDPFAFWVSRSLGVEMPVATALAWAVVGFEVALGVAFLMPRRGPLATSRLAKVSWGVACAAAVVTLLTRNMGDCGCFGALVAAKLPARLIVAGVIMWISSEHARWGARERRDELRPV